MNKPGAIILVGRYCVECHSVPLGLEFGVSHTPTAAAASTINRFSHFRRQGNEDSVIGAGYLNAEVSRWHWVGS